MANRTVKVTIEAAVAGAIANVKAFRGAVGDMGKEIDVLGKKHASAYQSIADTTAKLGLGLTLGFGLVTKAAMDFDKQMSEVAAVSNASGRSLDSLRQAALKAGKDTVFSASQAAQAEAELAKAGISTTNILGGGLTGALSLASAGSLNLADAATIAAQAMNIFHLQGKDVSHIADVLAAGANKSAADVGTLGEALRQGGLIASQTGMSLEETVGILSAFADRGLVASDAGTSLKTMFQKLQAPSDQSLATMKEYGITLYDEQGKFVGLTKFAGELHDGLKNLTQAQRDNAIATIFGTDAGRAAGIVYSLGSKGVEEYVNAVNDSGAASRTAGQKLNNLAGDVEQLKGSLETLAIQAGTGTNRGLRTLTQGATGVANIFLGLPGPIQQTITVLAGISGVTLLATSGLLRVRKAANDAMDALRAAGPLGEKAATGLGKVGKVAAGITVAGVAAGLAFEGLKALGDWLDKKSRPVARDIDAMTASLKEFAQSGKASGEVAKTFGADLRKLGSDVAQYQKYQRDYAAAEPGIRKPPISGGFGVTGIKIKNLKDEAAQARSDIAALDSALSGLASNGGAAQAYIAFVHISDALRAQGYGIDEINKLFPQYAKAAGDAAASNTGLAGGFADASAKASILSTSMGDLIAKGQTFKTTWDELNGALLSSDQAQLSANKAIENVTETLKRNKGAWKGNSDAALEDRIVVGQAAQAAADAAQKKYEETGSVDQANQVYQDYIGQLRASLMSVLHNKDAVDQLLAAYAKMPPSVTVNVKSNAGAEAARIQSVLDRLGAINGHTWTYKVVGNYIQTGSGKLPLNEKGGITVAAASGLATAPAGIYPAQNVGSFLFAEARTRGETLIPNYGIPAARGLALSDYAASHYGGRVVTGGWGAPTVNLVVAPAGGGSDFDRFMTNWFLESVRGGRLQLSVLPSGKVGQANR